MECWWPEQFVVVDEPAVCVELIIPKGTEERYCLQIPQDLNCMWMGKRH